jgi:hypothetical protein
MKRKKGCFGVPFFWPFFVAIAAARRNAPGVASGAFQAEACQRREVAPTVRSISEIDSRRPFAEAFFRITLGRGEAKKGSRYYKIFFVVAKRSTIHPAIADNSEPANTPILTSSICAPLPNARPPINRLMVKPIPQSNATP